MPDILKEVLNDIPKEADVSEACFEGANIVLYVKNKEFFLKDNGVIKSIVDKIKKRVEIRADLSSCMKQEKAEEKIKEIIPKDAGEINVIFDPQRSMVI